jgi:hypothetical protein
VAEFVFDTFRKEGVNIFLVTQPKKWSSFKANSLRLCAKTQENNNVDMADTKLGVGNVVKSLNREEKHEILVSYYFSYGNVLK